MRESFAHPTHPIDAQAKPQNTPNPLRARVFEFLHRFETRAFLQKDLFKTFMCPRLGSGNRGTWMPALSTQQWADLTFR
jgi:hypothetical protein